MSDPHPTTGAAGTPAASADRLPDGTPLQVDGATDEDLPGLARTVAAARLVGLAGCVDPAAEPGYTDWVLHVGRLLDDPAVSVVAARAGGTVVGMAAATVDGGGLHLAVHPDWHRRGVGGRLAARWEADLSRRGHTPSTLVWSGDRATNTLLAGRGWQATHEVHRPLQHGRATAPGGRVLLTRLVLPTGTVGQA